MKAFRIETGRRLAPFGDAVGALWVANQRLQEHQDAAIRSAGLTVVDAMPVDEPVLVFADDLWFTAELVRQVVLAGVGRLRISDEAWNAWTGPLQELSGPGEYQIGVVQLGQGEALDLQRMAPVDVALPFRDLDLDPFHPSIQRVVQHPVRVGPAMVHCIHHWSHLVRVNQLALLGRLEWERLGWDRAGFWGRIGKMLGVLLRARSTKGEKIAAALNERGRDLKIHSTAVVEFCQLGDGVEIGPHAVVRGCVIGAGVKIDSHAAVNASVVGDGAKIGRYAFLNLCTVFPGAQVSKGEGFQACVFGEGSFIAWGTTVQDLSFGQQVKVEVDGPGSARVDSGQHFLGACIGHRAVIGNGVRIRYGVSVPNDAVLVERGDDLLREWGDAPTGVPVTVQGGRPKPIN